MNPDKLTVPNAPAMLHTRQDDELTATANVPVTASTTTEGDKPLNTLPVLGISEEAQAVIHCDAASAAVTVKVLGAQHKGDEYTELVSYTTEASTALDKRYRIPLDWPQFLKLTVTTGSDALSAAITATLQIQV